MLQGDDRIALDYKGYNEEGLGGDIDLGCALVPSFNVVIYTISVNYYFASMSSLMNVVVTNTKL